MADQDPVADLLRKQPMSDAQRAQAWDAYYAAENEDALAESIKGIAMPSNAKAALWDLKHGGSVEQATPTAQTQQRSRTGQMYTPPSDAGPIGEFGEHLAAGLNPVNVIGGVMRVAGNVVTDPKEAGRQVVEGIAAPFRQIAQGNIAAGAGDLAAMAAAPSVYRNVGGKIVKVAGDVVQNPDIREAAVQHGATAAGAFLGGPVGAVVGRTVGDQIAARLRKPMQVVGDEPAMAAHLDRSVPVPASALTQQQIAERVNSGTGTPPAKTPKLGKIEPKSFVEAGAEVQDAVRASKSKVTMSEWLQAADLVKKRGISGEDALATVVLARGLPSDAEIARVVSAKNARTEKP